MTTSEEAPPPEPKAGPDEQDSLVKGVRLRGERHQQWLREGDP